MNRILRFQGMAYIRSLHEHYPELVDSSPIDAIDDRLHIGFVASWSRAAQYVAIDSPGRFQALGQRCFSTHRDVWATTFSSLFGVETLRRVGACLAYKGLIHLKPPSDIVLYSNLLWELGPRTIIEFGSLQGGSSLWFADQLEMYGCDGEVHSFEILDKCIHPDAVHPRLHFHRANLLDLTTLDRELFSHLPHPWLVVDDAHANVGGVMEFVGGFLEAGDYYVVEDVLMRPSADDVNEWIRRCDKLDLFVDTKYADAFGYNVTCSPNAWFRKSVPDR